MSRYGSVRRLRTATAPRPNPESSRLRPAPPHDRRDARKPRGRGRQRPSGHFRRGLRLYLSDDNLLIRDEDDPELLIAAISDRDQRIEKKAPRGRIPKDLRPRSGWRTSLRPREARTSTASALKLSSPYSPIGRPEDADASCAAVAPRARASGSWSARPTSCSRCGRSGKGQGSQPKDTDPGRVAQGSRRSAAPQGEALHQRLECTPWLRTFNWRSSL